MTNGQTIKRNARRSSAEREQARSDASEEAALAGVVAMPPRSPAHEVCTPCDCGHIERCTMERYIADVRVAYAQIVSLQAGLEYIGRRLTEQAAFLRRLAEEGPHAVHVGD